MSYKVDRALGTWGAATEGMPSYTFWLALAVGL